MSARYGHKQQNYSNGKCHGYAIIQGNPCIPCMDHIANEEAHSKIQQAIGEPDNLLTTYYCQCQCQRSWSYSGMATRQDRDVSQRPRSNCKAPNAVAEQGDHLERDGFGQLDYQWIYMTHASGNPDCDVQQTHLESACCKFSRVAPQWPSVIGYLQLQTKYR